MWAYTKSKLGFIQEKNCLHKKGFAYTLKNISIATAQLCVH